jgi:hypothetical protein
MAIIRISKGKPKSITNMGKEDITDNTTKLQFLLFNGSYADHDISYSRDAKTEPEKSGSMIALDIQRFKSVLVDDYITEPDKNVFDNYSAFIIEVVI